MAAESRQSEHGRHHQSNGVDPEAMMLCGDRQQSCGTGWQQQIGANLGDVVTAVVGVALWRRAAEFAASIGSVRSVVTGTRRARVDGRAASEGDRIADRVIENLASTQTRQLWLTR